MYIFFIFKIIHYKGMPKNLVKPIPYGSLHTKKIGGSGITQSTDKQTLHPM